MNLQEWKDSRRKTITLKSGLEVVIRKLSAVKMGEFGPIPFLEEVGKENQMETAKMIIIAGVISPKIGEGPDELSVYDLDMEDINELVIAITKIGQRPETLPTVEGGSSEGTQPSSSTE